MTAMDCKSIIATAVRGAPLGRPVTMNAANKRAGHWGARNTDTDKWRRAARKVFAGDMESGDLWPVRCVSIQVVPVYKTRNWPDVGAVAPSVKACIDALVDVGVIPDDNSPHLARITYERAVKGLIDGLAIRVREVAPLDGHPDPCGCRPSQRSS